MKPNNIFIHIPKTGGTTINCVMHKTEWQTLPDFNYRHILYETKRSNSKDIFNPLNYDKYSEYKIFTMLRNPADRIVSEYYFIRDRQEFMSLFKKKPKNLEEYIKNRQTQNYMVGFLLGKRMFDADFVTEDDYRLVINTINQLDIKIGVFENFEKSLNYFSKSTGIKVPKNVDVKRMTINRPKFSEIDDSIKKLVLEHNTFDCKLYDFGVEKFENASSGISSKTINFNGDKYNYILKYTERFNLLEIGLKDKTFIHHNKDYFEKLNLYLHHTLGLKDGKSYVKIWNSHFMSTINTVFPNSKLNRSLKDINETEPLGLTNMICKYLNLYVSSSKREYALRMNFRESLIDKTLIEKKKGFFNKLFS